MNGYAMMADSYRKLLATDSNADREFMERRITALEIMANTDRSTQYELFNSSAFNDIVRGYILMALDNAEAGRETSNAVLQEFNALLESVTAEQAENFYKDQGAAGT